VPHIAEELWEKIGEKDFVSNASWPMYGKKKLKIKEKKVDLNSKIVDLVRGYIGAKKVSQIYLYVLPFELEKFDSVKIGKALGVQVKIFATNDKKKIDPAGKSKKARPGQPGIYFE